MLFFTIIFYHYFAGKNWKYNNKNNMSDTLLDQLEARKLALLAELAKIEDQILDLKCSHSKTSGKIYYDYDAAYYAYYCTDCKKTIIPASTTRQ